MRLVLAGLILLIMERVVFGRNIISPLRNAKTTVGILVAGLLILVSQLTFMLSVAASNAGTAAIVLTLVPLICACWLSLTEKRPLTIREGICFVLAASGVFLIVTKGNFTSLDFSFEGVLWGWPRQFFLRLIRFSRENSSLKSAWDPLSVSECFSAVLLHP